MAPDANFILVADGQRFEDPAIILVGSLRRQHAANEANIHVYCPAEKIDHLTGFFREAIEFFGARIVPIPAVQTPFSTPYPHGNKMLAAVQPREGERTAFFDTDMIALGPVLPALGADRIGAVPEGVPTWGSKPGEWESAYGHFGLDLPDERIRLCRGRQMETLPYFNAGFLSWPEKSAFARLWLDTAIALDAAPEVKQKRPWLDQIAMPVAIRRSGLPYETLPEKYNYSYYRREYPLSDEIAVGHYHIPGEFRRDIQALTVYREILRAMPAEMAQSLRKRTEPFVMPGRAKKRVGFVPLIDLDE